MHRRQVEISNVIDQILKTKRSYVIRYIKINYKLHFHLAATEYKASVWAESVTITTSNKKSFFKGNLC